MIEYLASIDPSTWGAEDLELTLQVLIALLTFLLSLIALRN